LKAALQADFVGYEKLYREFAGFVKFGNDNDYVDNIAAELVQHFFSYLLTKRTFRGGIYTGGCSPFKRAAFYGAKVKAMPNGKRAEDTVIADSIGAVPGEDVNGCTALLKSVLKYNHAIAGSGFILNLKFNKNLFGSGKGTEAVKALTGESQLDLSVINSMLLRHRALLDEEAKAVEEARANLEAEEKNRKVTEDQVGQLLTWAERYDQATYEAKHLIIAALVDRVEVNKDYQITIHFKVSAEQFLGKVARSA